MSFDQLSDVFLGGVIQAEGLEQFFSSSLLLDVSSSQSSLSKHLTFSFPPELVMGSERASVTVVGMSTENHTT